MKRIIAFFMFFLMGFANAQELPIQKLVFFGDSLTDNGNLYSLTLHIVPKSPPYFQGRFSNGPTWAEGVSKNYSAFRNYAVGGATAMFHMPSTRFVAPTLLELEVNAYLIESLFADKSKSLFTIWIGGNDYLFDPKEDVDTETTQVVDKISLAIKTLNYYGAKNFLIMNLPDLARIPRLENNQARSLIHELTIAHNKKLEAAVQAIQATHPDIHITYVDLYEIFNDVIDNPAKYNEKYNVNITNTTDACWKGGIFYRSTISERTLESEIENAVKLNKMSTSDKVDVDVIKRFIMDTPELAATYQLGKSYEFGNVPCDNPDEHLFWDFIHPSAVVHQVLAQIVMEKLGAKHS